MTPPTNHSQCDKEWHQRNSVTRILPLQPCRAMRTSQPPPRIRIQEKGCSNVLRANRALCLRHGAHLSVIPLQCRRSSIASIERVDHCALRYASGFGGVADAEVGAIGMVEDEGADAGFGVHHHAFG